jgi:hypothetical protein
MSQSYPVQWKAVAAIFASVAVLSGLVAIFSVESALVVTRDPAPGGEQGWGFSATLIATITCVVSTISTVSSLWLSWRADRRQSREMDVKLTQLQMDLERQRQHPPQSN